MALSDNKKSYNIILEKHIKSELDKIAKMENRSTSNLINHLLKQYLKDKEGEK